MIWGFLPLYLHTIAFAQPAEVLGQRILWSIPAAIIAIFFMSGSATQALRDLRSAMNAKMLLTLLTSSIFIFVNWGIYVWLVLSHRVIESALAYFLAPLVAVAVGVLFFKEKVSTPQIIALSLALVGVVVQGWLVRRYDDDRVTVGVGYGPYFGVDTRARAADQDQSRRSRRLTIAASYRFAREWAVRGSFSRVVTTYNRDTDVFMLDLGYRF